MGLVVLSRGQVGRRLATCDTIVTDHRGEVRVADADLGTALTVAKPREQLSPQPT